MGELQIADDKARSLRVPPGERVDPLPEERQLVAKAVTVAVGKIAGEVPPFCLEIRVGMMISRKFISPAWLRRFPIGAESAKREQHDQVNVSCLHSLRKLSARTRRPARQAGTMPAITAATKI